MTETNPIIGKNFPPVEPKVKAFAEAVATAEGWYAHNPGHTIPLPRRANNPGDLKMGDKGHGTIDGKTIYASESDGWAALDHQVSLMLYGASHLYERGMTISQVAQIYTGADHAPEWAEIVAEHLGVDVKTSLIDYLLA